jgi:molecular chaperone DnaJ
VARDADQKTIKDAFRTLALKYHPDRNKAPDAEGRFKEIAEAYAVLSDPKKRAEYDARGLAGVGGLSAEDLFGGINFDDIFGGLGFDFDLGGDREGAWRGGGLFDRFFRRRHAGPQRGGNLEVELEIPLDRVVTGGEETVHLARPQTCAARKGTGAKPGTSPRSCEACQGTGQHRQTEQRGDVSFTRVTTCANCRGAGKTIEEFCPECRGRGEIERDETLTVKIPVGVEDGMALRIPGHGAPSQAIGGAPGDLFVVIRSAPDARFERRGADLWRTEVIEIPDAALGASLEAPTLEGSITVKIPPGTQPGAVLRLRGKGLPEFGSGKYGDLFLRLQAHVPEKLSDEERKLYEQLRALKQKPKQKRQTAT